MVHSTISRSVSYTHLDVYKRQVYPLCGSDCVCEAGAGRQMGSGYGDWPVRSGMDCSFGSLWDCRNDVIQGQYNTPMLFRADSVSKSYCTNPLDYVSVSGNILIVDWLNLFHKFAEIFQFCNGSASLLKGLVIFFFFFFPKLSLING